MVKLPVNCAAGMVVELLLKYPPKGQPRKHKFLYWQGPLPNKGTERLAVRDMTKCLPEKLSAMLFCKGFSMQFISIGGKNSPSGICSNSSLLPLMPANFST
jgi:hypothetical protein